MEEFHASAGAHMEPEDRAAPALDAGRLGGILCQLQRERFDGMLHIASAGQSASIGFRDGAPVTLDDPTPGHILADQTVDRGQLTRAQCNMVLARMTDALVDDETVAFCEHAVQLGYLTEDEANVELSSRIRARLIQLFGWRDCETTLTPGIAALLDRREFPQNLGAVLYMGVRTFYEEEFLSSCQPDLTQTYARLVGSPATIAHFFGLDDEEFQLLRRIQPELPVAQLLASGRKVERVHLLALLLLLRLGQFCEISNQPLSRPFNPRQPTPRERRVRHELPHEDKSATRRAPTSPATARPNPPTLSPNTIPPALPDPPPPRPAAKSSVDATQEALLEAAARTARLRRSLPPRRQPKQAEPSSATAAEGGSVAVRTPEAPSAHAAPGAKPAEPGPEYAKAHLKELIARRKHAADVSETQSSSRRDAPRELREARGLLQGQHFARAEKLLASLVELQPQNEAYKAYYLWARWRAQPEAAEGSIGELRDLAKKLVAEPEHGAFCAYVLGHVFMHEKRDDLAEKFFKRAHAADRGNKDAERHLVILERRKQAAADGGSGANRKLFGIQLPNSKPKA